MIGSFLPSLSFAHARDNNIVPNSIFIGVRDRNSYQVIQNMQVIRDSRTLLGKSRSWRRCHRWKAMLQTTSYIPNTKVSSADIEISGSRCLFFDLANLIGSAELPNGKMAWVCEGRLMLRLA